MWIHEQQNWSKITWDSETLFYKFTDIRYRKGRLFRLMEGLGLELKREDSLTTLTNDIVKSSAIEGESNNPEVVLSSIARRLGIDTAGLIPTGRDVEVFVETMLDASPKLFQRAYERAFV